MRLPIPAAGMIAAVLDGSIFNRLKVVSVCLPVNHRPFRWEIIVVCFVKRQSSSVSLGDNHQQFLMLITVVLVVG